MVPPNSFMHGRYRLRRCGFFLQPTTATTVHCERTHTSWSWSQTPCRASSWTTTANLLQQYIPLLFQVCATLQYVVRSPINSMYCGLNPLRTAVPFWGQTSQIIGSLSPKRDCGPIRVKAKVGPFYKYNARDKKNALGKTTTTSSFASKKYVELPSYDLWFLHLAFTHV